ncbi:MAG: hypothetical protein GXY24_06265 [Bacteroidales bacterium]|jgi:hypothetical protein|nr:hypothetical protein [Bacteroidales bacterium]
MKKTIFAALAALLPLFISCGNQNNTEEGFEEPRFVQSAGQLIPASGTLQSVDLSESGIFVVGETTGGGGGQTLKARTKAGDGSGTKYTSGEYEVNGNVYTLKGWGTLEFSNTASGDVELTYTPSGKSAVTVNARFTKSTAGSDIYRSWRVDKTRVTLVQGATTYAAEFSGCDFNEVADFFEDNGHALSDDIPSGRRISTLSITGAGALFFVYNDGAVDVGSCTVSGNVLNYVWADSSMGYSFETGRVSFSFQDGKCIFVIEAKLDGNTTASVKLVLDDID